MGSDHDPGAKFASYRSFALMPRNRLVMNLPPDPMHNPLVISRVEDEIEQELQRKGFTLTDLARADFVVDFTIGAIDVFDMHDRRPVWHGWAQKELTRKEMEQSAAPIHDAVQSVLAKFPPAV